MCWHSLAAVACDSVVVTLWHVDSAGHVVVSANVWSEVKHSFVGDVLPSGRVTIVSMKRPLQVVSLKRTQFPMFDDGIRGKLGTSPAQGAHVW